MARTRGTASFSANYEPQIAAPLDARYNKIDTKAELYLAATWTANDGNIYVYMGMQAYIYNDGIPGNRGLYILKSIDYTLESSWEQISNTIVVPTDESTLAEWGTDTLYEGGKTYYVSRLGNIYKFKLASPGEGQPPVYSWGEDPVLFPAVWQLVSTGSLNHIQNTDYKFTDKIFIFTDANIATYYTAGDKTLRLQTTGVGAYNIEEYNVYLFNLTTGIEIGYIVILGNFFRRKFIFDVDGMIINNTTGSYGIKTITGASITYGVNDWFEILRGITIDNEIILDSKLIALLTVQNAITKEPSGFVDATDDMNKNIGVAYSHANKTITLTGNFKAYWRGTELTTLTNGWVSDPHDDGVVSSIFLIYDGVSIQWIPVASFKMYYLLIAVVVADSTGVRFAHRETHGLLQWQDHFLDHFYTGTLKSSGGTTTSGSYVSASTTATNRRPLFDETVLQDEDLQTTIPALLSASYTCLYMSGASTYNIVTGQTEIIRSTGGTGANGRLNYNQFVTGAWQQTQCASNEYMCLWKLEIPVTSDTTSQLYRRILIQGQQTSSNIDTIRGLSPNSLTLGGFSALLAECYFTEQIILRSTSNNWTVIETRLLTGSRNQQISTTGSFLSGVATNATLKGVGVGSNLLGVVGNNFQLIVYQAPVYYASGYIRQLVQQYVANTSLFLEERCEYTGDYLTKKEILDDATGLWYKIEYTYTAGLMDLPTYTAITAWTITV